MPKYTAHSRYEAQQMIRDGPTTKDQVEKALQSSRGVGGYGGYGGGSPAPGPDPGPTPPAPGPGPWPGNDTDDKDCCEECGCTCCSCCKNCCVEVAKNCCETVAQKCCEKYGTLMACLCCLATVAMVLGLVFGLLPSDGTCTDGSKNGDETGVDCGGSCEAQCADGSDCEVAADCLSGFCSLDKRPGIIARLRDSTKCQPGLATSVPSVVSNIYTIKMPSPTTLSGQRKLGAVQQSLSFPPAHNLADSTAVAYSGGGARATAVAVGGLRALAIDSDLNKLVRQPLR